MKEEHACKDCLLVTSAINPEFNHFHFIVVVSHGEIMYQDLKKNFCTILVEQERSLITILQPETWLDLNKF